MFAKSLLKLLCSFLYLFFACISISCVVFYLPLWHDSTDATLSIPLPLHSHSRLQPAAQDPELRGGAGAGPHQREDATPPRQQPARGSALPQQPAHQHRTPGQERHQCTGLKKEKKSRFSSPSSLPSFYPTLPSSFLPSLALPIPFPPSLLVSFKSRRREEGVQSEQLSPRLIYFII